MDTKIKKMLTILMTVLGIVIMAYPWISMKLNQKNASHVIDGYEKKIRDCSEEKKKQILKAARIYNQKILNSNVIMTDPFDEKVQKITTEEYEEVLNVDGSGMIGYLNIDKINVSLPVYHGVSQRVLEKNVGHLKETSFPIKGQDIHSVLSAHTGMANARLFSDLDKLKTGDCFQVRILDECLTYKIYKMEVVLPEEVSSLGIRKGKNICTLITCTPYGVNTHRLLVHGEMIKTDKRMKKEKQKFTVNKKLRFVSMLIIVVGIVICIYPYACRRKFVWDSEKRINEFCKLKKYKDTDLKELRLKMKAYNRHLFQEGQCGLKDAWSYEQNKWDLEKYGLKRDLIGYIEIPEIKVKLPVYLGANKENMKKGAAHLSQTSLPIGGKNTNCVIAAHRGYAKAAMFRDLNWLKKGDQIYITNLWDTRCYEVCETKVILPDEVEQVIIQEGKDLVTLITCHPFRHNYQRLVVYCEYKK